MNIYLEGIKARRGGGNKTTSAKYVSQLNNTQSHCLQ